MYSLLSFQNNLLKARSIFQSEYLVSNVRIHAYSLYYIVDIGLMYYIVLCCSPEGEAGAS